ncbi:helix-turn-helix domain-containing protein [Diplocloster hominis]|uniref:helix-turn-helix domain-containing protein n=1 Tax=Diplocloster hominis TaxID=3079010 RepID=UPI0031B9F59D
MIDKLMDAFVNPVKSKLLLEIYTHQKITTKELSAAFPDIPQATMYRHMNRMLKDGLIEVVEENKIRGVTEKVYGIAFDFDSVGKQLFEKNPGTTLLQMFTQYMMAFLQEFKDYSRRDHINPEQEPFSFTVCPCYASPEEIKDALTRIGEILTPLIQNPSTPDRKMHSFGVILTPPKEF